MDDFIERRIVTGLIVDDTYIKEISKVWDSRFLESTTACMLCHWCLDYFNKYQQAPKKDIEGIFTARMKNLDKDHVEDIGNILSGLSHEYEREQFNSQYLLDQTYKYFQEQNLRQFADNVKGEITAGQLTEAENLASSYQSVKASQVNSINPFASAAKIKEVFAERQKPLIHFGKALGKFLNSEMTRDGFVAFMGREKIGKTWLLMEIAMRANRSGCNVAFFQAGDMTENQYILRQCIYLTKKSHKEKYCTGVWLPVLDCIHNQTGECDKEERESIESVFEEGEERNYETLIEVSKSNPDYRICRNCKQLQGTPWLIQQPLTQALTWKEAYKAIKKWKKRFKKQFRLSTYANETFSISEMKAVLDTWEHQEEFIPDVIVIDYADLLTSDPDIRGLDFRNRQNIIWQRLRALSQQKHCLVVTATQTSARAYGKKLLGMQDFSEDKRKYAHVTAMYGLNQTDKEKQIGIIRINQIVVREDDFSTSKPVHVLQRLQIGKPVLESY